MKGGDFFLQMIGFRMFALVNDDIQMSIPAAPSRAEHKCYFKYDLFLFIIIKEGK